MLPFISHEGIQPEHDRYWGQGHGIIAEGLPLVFHWFIMYSRINLKERRYFKLGETIFIAYGCCKEMSWYLSLHEFLATMVCSFLNALEAHLIRNLSISKVWSNLTEKVRQREECAHPSWNMHVNTWATQIFPHEKIQQASACLSDLLNKTALKFVRTGRNFSCYKLLWHFWLQCRYASHNSLGSVPLFMHLHPQSHAFKLLFEMQSVNLQSTFIPKVHREPEIQNYTPSVSTSTHILRLCYLALIYH